MPAVAERAVGMAVNRWHEVERLGCSEAVSVSGAALGRDSHTFEAWEASTVKTQRHSRLSRSDTIGRGNMLAGIAYIARRGREQVVMVLRMDGRRSRGRRQDT
jgi:hypothetical protein